MKCIKNVNDGEVFRAMDKIAHILVDTGDFEFIERKVWKDTGRKYFKRAYYNAKYADSIREV